MFSSPATILSSPAPPLAAALALALPWRGLSSAVPGSYSPVSQPTGCLGEDVHVCVHVYLCKCKHVQARLHARVRAHICTRTGVHVCACTCGPARVRVCACTRACADVHVRLHACLRAHTCTCTCGSVCTCACVHGCVHACVRTRVRGGRSVGAAGVGRGVGVRFLLRLR